MRAFWSYTYKLFTHGELGKHAVLDPTGLPETMGSRTYWYSIGEMVWHLLLNLRMACIG
jgi:hypothetical protein